MDGFQLRKARNMELVPALQPTRNKTRTKARRIFVLHATTDPYQPTEWRNRRNGTDPTEFAPGTGQSISESEMGNTKKTTPAPDPGYI